jgi:hypothetical protein
MLYFSESCVEVKIHHEPSSFEKKIFNNVQFSTRVCDFDIPFCIAIIRYAM